MTVSINPPKTPVTKGSSGVATATIPNVCKMPGPPAPFIPVPLPNIGKSDKSPKGYSKKVNVEGKKVAIKGASFKSMGDIASKGTGGGLISANTEGPTKFIGPGSMDVKFEGKNVHLLSDPMLNNCGPGGSPPNAATVLGIIQATGVTYISSDECPLCNEAPHDSLDETVESEADSEALVQAYGAYLQALPGNSGARRKLKSNGTMLGVAHCKCPDKYASQSGKNSEVLVSAADELGMHHRHVGKKTKDVLNSIKEHAGNNEVFDRVIAQAEQIQREFAADVTLPAAFPPGSCAAQGAMVLALDDGGIPIAISEKWYHPENLPTASNIRHVNVTPDGVWKIVDRPFNQGETVPPCGSCELILELLLCFSKDAVCDHP